ncbi:MAG TPA: PQQ-binding-like beta-propeller repeat protein, partial [Aggregatilineales bacterium]|nr:PQQ-binding-like beta-propeller repeat protein [Aggregatilineales bacterium]
YIGGRDGIFRAITLVDGSVVWEHDLSSEIYASASVTETDVFVFGYNGVLHAFNREDGAVLWRFELGNIAYSSPSVAEEVVYALSENQGMLYALDTRTGAELWHAVTGTQGDYRSSAPVLVDGVLFVGSNSEGLLVFGSEG